MEGSSGAQNRSESVRMDAAAGDPLGRGPNPAQAANAWGGSVGRAIVGSSRSLQGALDSLALVAATSAPVLILGETGTGKELFARALHERSRRAGRDFVRLDCASLAPTLCESELFGHARGAFTGASQRRTGRVELAHQGSLFLDEIGELPLELQAKLLRVLQEGEFEPLGSERTIKVDIRVIAATNRSLAEEVAAGRFRADLYHRLATFPVLLPALRDRLDDLPDLVEHFVALQAQCLGRSFSPVAPDVIERLRRHSWPGNVRELGNAVQRACILARGSSLSAADFEPLGPVLPDPLRAAVHTGEGLVDESLTLREVERRHIAAILDRCRGVIEGPRGAAAMLGLAPSTLRFRIRKLEIPQSRREDRLLGGTQRSDVHGGMLPVGSVAPPR